MLIIHTNMLMKRPLQLVQLDLPQSVNLLGVMTRPQISYLQVPFLSSVLYECVMCVECSLSCKIRYLSHNLAVCRCDFLLTRVLLKADTRVVIFFFVK